MHRSDTVMQAAVYAVSALTLGLFLLVLAYMFWEGRLVFQHTSLAAFLSSSIWQPLTEPGHFGIAAMLAGSLYVSLLALIVAFPIGAGCAVFTIFCLSPRIRSLVLPCIDMIAGIPSVVFGFIGLMVLVSYMESAFHMASGECIFAGALLLAFMIIPFIVTNCSESILRLQQQYSQASLNLGVSKWYMLWHLLLPQAAPAFLLSIILAFSRAMGETMAVMMVTGNAKVWPTLFGKGETIPALIALEMGSAEYDSPHYYALYAAAAALLVLLLLCNLLVYVGARRMRKEEAK